MNENEKCQKIINEHPNIDPLDGSAHMAIPQYKTDISDAWKLVEFMRRAGFSFGIETSGFNREFQATFFMLDENTKYVENSKTAPQAIVAAFLAANRD